MLVLTDDRAGAVAADARRIAARPAASDARTRLAVWSDRMATWCLIGLAAILPYAHTGRIQSTLLAGAIAGWVGRWYADRTFKWTRTPVDLPMALWVGWGIVTLATATDALYSVREIKNELVAQAVLFVLAASVARRGQDVWIALGAVTVAALVISVRAVADFGWHPEWVLTRAFRTQSFTPSPIFLALYVVLVIPLVLYVASSAPRRVVRIAAWAVFLLAVVALVTSGTRGAYIAVFVEGLVYGVVRNRRFATVWMAGAAILVGLAVAVPSIRSQIPVEAWTGDGGRRVFWEHIVPWIADSPVVGFGYGQETLDRAFPGFRTSVSPIDTPHAFNLFIEVLFETGVVGLAIFAWLLWRIVSGLWRVARLPNDPDAALFATCVLMAVVGFVVENQFDFFLRDSPGHLFWVVVGLGIGWGVRASAADPAVPQCASR